MELSARKRLCEGSLQGVGELESGSLDPTGIRKQIVGPMQRDRCGTCQYAIRALATAEGWKLPEAQI